MNINRRKGFMALSLAAVMAVGGAGAALADEREWCRVIRTQKPWPGSRTATWSTMN